MRSKTIEIEGDQLKVSEVTELLAAWSDGDNSALEKLLPLVQDELHRLAHRYMSHERKDHTLQTTALVNEAYLKLVEQRVDWRNREHFFAIAAWKRCVRRNYTNKAGRPSGRSPRLIQR